MKYYELMSRRLFATIAVAGSFLAVAITGCYPVSYADSDPAPLVDPEYEEYDDDYYNDDDYFETPEPAPITDEQPGGGIRWDEAAANAGTYQRVCGPFAGWGYSDNDVFFNLGVDYPNPNRFTIVIWDIGSLEPIPLNGTTVCVAGAITMYNGASQIQLYDPSVIEVYG